MFLGVGQLFPPDHDETEEISTGRLQQNEHALHIAQTMRLIRQLVPVVLAVRPFAPLYQLLSEYL